ncbi:hypothetical protein BV898_17760 [Hypsibius exemplaris]|uniref:Uncharacterized protein n=1 Tax=Hypsibius exemplaris TaxID=2072580 RepID=A0A9X6NIK9_HYPEX|nr:hypothetical protein BV898_17760 [Hypsibius exemplaris]
MRASRREVLTSTTDDRPFFLSPGWYVMAPFLLLTVRSPFSYYIKKHSLHLNFTYVKVLKSTLPTFGPRSAVPYVDTQGAALALVPFSIIPSVLPRKDFKVVVTDNMDGKIADDPTVVEVYSVDDGVEPASALPFKRSPKSRDEIYLTLKAENLEQKGRMALACGAFFIALDISLALSMSGMILTVKPHNARPSGWDSVCRERIIYPHAGLSRPRRDAGKAKRPSRARIG